MKLIKVLLFGVLLSGATLVSADAEQDKIDALSKEIGDLQKTLALKQAEYEALIKSLDLANKGDVKMRGSRVDQCAYQCDLRHRNDYYMWQSCFDACT